MVTMLRLGYVKRVVLSSPKETDNICAMGRSGKVIEIHRSTSSGNAGQDRPQTMIWQDFSRSSVTGPPILSNAWFLSIHYMFMAMFQQSNDLTLNVTIFKLDTNSR